VDGVVIERRPTDSHPSEAAVEPSKEGNTLSVAERAGAIRLLLTDSDGVLTDNGVYYSSAGEEMKRFSIRDGMGVERLRKIAAVDVGIITGEHSGPVQRRAEKLTITELHLGIKDKPAVLREILARHQLRPEQIAYIGDDTNDVEVMKLVGLAACPADATPFAKAVAHYICASRGGYGAFREVAELIITARADSDAVGDK
jgi:3-deoxy-D-manno-octulosonate 8-phosphate phosphatase (KDO 8-P phosphatase)